MLINKEKLKQNQKVSIHSFGDGLVGTGKVVGVSSDMFPVLMIYIVEMDTDNPWKDQMNGYSCITVPHGCLDPIYPIYPPITCKCGDVQMSYHEIAMECEKCHKESHYISFYDTCIDCINLECESN